MISMSSNGNIKLWTAQSKIVVDTIESKGIYHVKREFILNKYREISKLFLEPYDWFVGRASKIITPPPGAEYAIWMYANPGMISNYGPGDYIIEAEVPRDNVLMLDEGKWLRILNLSYIPLDSKDEERFKNSIREYGLTHDSQAYTSNFYPALKREITRSWDRLFDDSIKLSEFRMGALWELKREWIKEISEPK
ncbi:hypothetical protein EAL2_c12820 [Peptoclostridium acidaminophilum DSM 3953]|uniref:Uncharacterized protein n=1 Tax=Peptoclostridium acidaminophilum DSM 3953 TaxID=1286171 RepID=W8TK51_PEPAC|nr:DUF3841 domain-containing protein [Peptoclostridium acidaminophilum]AHM56577.1 hypothetical protein EAL2_c12820 [Peptoclostridium acidaminophilum DSM 3953]